MTEKLYGIYEIARILGQRRQTVAQWHTRGQLPEPDARLAMGPVWRESTIKNYLLEGLLMKGVKAYFCEFEDQHEVGGEHITGCITYPVTITTASSASSHGHPVIVIDGEPRGVADMPSGELQLPDAVYDDLRPVLDRIGYRVCDGCIDDSFADAWEAAGPAEHWHPGARLVQF